MNIKTFKIEPFKIKNNLESSASSPSILDFSHSKTKENNRFWYLNKNKENENQKENNYFAQFNYLDVLEKKKKKTHPYENLYFREIPSLNDQLHVHPNTGFAKLKKSKKYLSNYQAAMLDLLGETEGGKSGGNNW